jgi:hypothetical protein
VDRAGVKASLEPISLARKLWLETYPLHASADVVGDDSEQPGERSNADVTAAARAADCETNPLSGNCYMTSLRQIESTAAMPKESTGPKPQSGKENDLHWGDCIPDPVFSD